jgi:hypothetical protein
MLTEMFVERVDESSPPCLFTPPSPVKESRPEEKTGSFNLGGGPFFQSDSFSQASFKVFTGIKTGGTPVISPL